MKIETYVVRALTVYTPNVQSKDYLKIEAKGFTYNIYTLESNKTDTGIYLNLSECKRELKKMCVERIIELSEIIGTLPKIDIK